MKNDRERLRNPPKSLADLALEIFGPKHGVELDLHPRVVTGEQPRFDSADFDVPCPPDTND
jgi:hypothetical protein